MREKFSKVTMAVKENGWFTALSLVALIVAFLPLFTTNCIGGHDIEYHLLRIEALKEGILAGRPFLKVNMLYFGGRGYASSLFYPDFLLYIPALLRCMGVSINLSFHIFVGVCILLAFCSMYYCAGLLGKEILNTDGRMTGLIAAVCYTLAQYHIDDLYTRSAVGEYTAMIFLPFICYGIYDLSYQNIKRPALLVTGFAGTLLCHTNTTMFVIALYFVVFLAALLRDAFNKNIKNWLPRLLDCAAITAIITCFYYLPVLEQFASQSFQTNAGGFDLDYEKLQFMNLFVNRNPALGIYLPVLVLITGFMAHGVKSERIRFADVCSLIATVFALMTTGIIPWKRLQGVLAFVQFPWRLLIMVTPFLCIAAAIYSCDFVKKGFSRRLLMTVLTGCMIVSAVSNIERLDQEYYSYSDDYYSYVPFTGAVIGGEWLPESVIDRDALTKKCDMAVCENGNEIQVNRSRGRTYISVSGTEGYIDVPLIYYKGYKARYASREECKIDIGNNGCVRIYPESAGEIAVDYEGTAVQHISLIISLTGFIGIIFFVLKKKKKSVR